MTVIYPPYMEAPARNLGEATTSNIFEFQHILLGGDGPIAKNRVSLPTKLKLTSPARQICLQVTTHQQWVKMKHCDCDS